MKYMLCLATAGWLALAGCQSSSHVENNPDAQKAGSTELREDDSAYQQDDMETPSNNEIRPDTSY